MIKNTHSNSILMLEDMESLNIFDSIAWTVTDPLEEIERHNEDGENYEFHHKKTQRLLNKRVFGIEPGDRVVILTIDNRNDSYNPITPAVSSEIRKTGKYFTVLDVMKAIYEGFHKKIPHARIGGNRYLEHMIDRNQYIYSRVGQFHSSDIRVKLIRKYESDKLSPADLEGEFTHFEGLHRGREKYEKYLFLNWD